MVKVMSNPSPVKEKSRFIFGAGIFAISTAVGSSLGKVMGAVGSIAGGYLGSRVARGKSEKFILNGLGIINATDFLLSSVTQKEVLV